MSAGGGNIKDKGAGWRGGNAVRRLSSPIMATEAADKNWSSNSGGGSAEPPHSPGPSTKDKSGWKRLGNSWKTLVDIVEDIKKIGTAVLVIIAAAAAIIAFMNTPGPQSRSVAFPQTSTSSPSSSTTRPSPTNSTGQATPSSSARVSIPQPSARDTAPDLVEHKYEITLPADWGIPSIQDREIAKNISEQAVQDLYYRMYAREFVSLDGGKLAFPYAAPASYEACKHATRTTPTISIKSQQYQPFCLITSDGIIVVARIVPPMPKFNLLAPDPDPVKLEIKYWT